MRQVVNLICVLLFAVCAVQRQATNPVNTASSSTVKVVRESERVMKAYLEVDIYSGLPNPKRELTDEQFRHLMERLKTLAVAEPAKIFDGLGYRGLVVTFINVRGEPVTLRVYKGIIQLSEDGQTTFLADSERQVARLLLEFAQKWLANEVVKLVAAEEQVS